MKLYKNLFLDDISAKKKSRIIRRLRVGIGQINVFAICLAGNNDLFEIVHVSQFKQKYYPRKDVYIFGIASSYDSAVLLVVDMVEFFSKKYNTYDFKPFLISEINKVK